jgi:hypothetical protein
MYIFENFSANQFVCIADDFKLHTIKSDNTHKPIAIQRTFLEHPVSHLMINLI